MNSNIPLSDWPVWAYVVLAVLVAVQLALQVFAFIRLFRTPDDRLSAKRWVWALIILFGEALGAIVFLAAGRKPAAAVDPMAAGAAVQGAPAGDRAARAADVLYGSKEGDEA